MEEHCDVATPSSDKSVCSLIISCLYCNEIVKDLSVEEHLPVCPSYPCQCPRKCSIKDLKRSQLKSHKMVCPLEPVRCVYYTLGCHVTLDRHMLSQHMETSLVAHNELLMSFVESSKKESNSLRDELKKMYSEVSIFVERSLQIQEDLSTEIGIIESLVMQVVPDGKNLLNCLSVMRSMLQDLPPLNPCGNRLTYRLPSLSDRNPWDGPSCILGNQWILQISFTKSSNYLTSSIAHIMLRRLPSNSNPKWPTDSHISINLSTTDGCDTTFTLSSDSSTCTLPIRIVDTVINAHDPVLINLANVMIPCCEDDPLIIAVIRLNIKPSQVFHLFVK